MKHKQQIDSVYILMDSDLYTDGKGWNTLEDRKKFFSFVDRFIIGQELTLDFHGDEVNCPRVYVDNKHEIYFHPDETLFKGIFASEVIVNSFIKDLGLILPNTKIKKIIRETNLIDI